MLIHLIGVGNFAEFRTFHLLLRIAIANQHVEAIAVSNICDYFKNLFQMVVELLLYSASVLLLVLLLHL